MKGLLMNDERNKECIINIISLLKGLARNAKNDADNPDVGLEDYAQGVIMGYYSIITLLKHQAFVFCMDQKELGLADIKPDVELLGLHRNPDIDFGEDNWAIDVMNEERAKGYLVELVALLKEQAKEAKVEADHPKEGNDSYNKGYLMAYHAVISLMKNQARAFDIDQKEIGLTDIEPERDLL
jgi:hypothetical protein